MINKELTDVEQTFIDNWYRGSDVKYDINDRDRDSINITFFRDLMKRTAHHEAGHCVARMFTDLEFSHVRRLSIIPDKVTNGRMICERPFAERLIEHVPIQVQRSEGYCLLLGILAGYGSVMIMENSEYENLWDYFYEELYIDDEYYADGADLCRAERIAGILSRPHFSKDRILGMTANWTVEMLHIPAIWNAVKAVAAMLISEGEITTDGNEEVFFNIRKELNVPRVTKIPKWSRRIYGK